MLNKPVDDIIMENGKVVGVKSEGEVSLPHAVGSLWLWQDLIATLGALFLRSLTADGSAAPQLQGSKSWELGRHPKRGLQSHFCWQEVSLKDHMLCL